MAPSDAAKDALRRLGGKTCSACGDPLGPPPVLTAATHDPGSAMFGVAIFEAASFCSEACQKKWWQDWAEALRRVAAKVRAL